MVHAGALWRHGARVSSPPARAARHLDVSGGEVPNLGKASSALRRAPTPAGRPVRDARGRSRCRVASMDGTPATCHLIVVSRVAPNTRAVLVFTLTAQTRAARWPTGSLAVTSALGHRRAFGHDSREAYPRTRELTVLCSVSRSHSWQRQSPGEHQKVRDPKEIGVGRPIPVEGYERIGCVTLFEVDRILLEKALCPACVLGPIQVQRRRRGQIRPAHRRSGHRSGPARTPRR